MAWERVYSVILAGILLPLGYADASVLPLVVDGAVRYQASPPEHHAMDDYSTVRLCNNGHIGEQWWGIIEFDASMLVLPARQATLTLWQLDRSVNFGSSVHLYAYEGDGQVTVPDHNAPGTFVTTVSFPPGYNFGHGVAFDTEVHPALQVAWAKGWRYLGLRLEVPISNPGDVHYASEGTPYFGGQPPRLVYETTYPGDTDMDGDVDDDDLSVLLANYWNQEATWATGDFTGDNFVADNDLSLLLANWTGIGAVPEPATLGLLALGVLILARRR